MTPALVGIDVGSTRVKAVMVDPTGRELAAAADATPWLVDGNTVEMDPDALIDVVRHVVATVVADRPEHTVAAVGVTGVGESGVLLDRHGRPTAPIIAWYDQRGDVDAVAAALPEFTAVTGTRLDKVATIFKLPGLLRHGGGVRWLNIAEWVVRSLGGDEQAEMSLAGRTGLCDLHRAAWWSDALDYLGADRTLLPGDPVLGKMGAGRATFGPIAGAGLAVAGHDHQVAAFVSGATEPGFLFESLGTADALALTVPAPVAVADVLAVAEAGATIGRTVIADRLMVMAGLRTGQILERIGRLLGVEDRTARRRLSERAASREPDRTMAVNLADGLVSITGVGDDTDAADLWAAAVAATDQRTRDLVDAYARRFGPARGVVVGGGWLNDPTIAAAVHRRFPSAVHSRFSEPGAVGAACVAGISVGVLDGADAMFTPGGHT